MNTRERIGIGFLIAAMGVAPFGYWLSFGWALIALVLFVPAVLLMWTGRVARRLAEPSALDRTVETGDVLPGVHDVKGFHSVEIFNHGDHADGGDTSH
jgi:hypothetical protein